METNSNADEQWAQREDEELLQELRAGHTDALDALLLRYKKIVKQKAQSYYLAGADREDLLQEGMIGLYKAICDYRDDKGASFRTFAELCIDRQLASAIKMASRKKHRPLNDYVSLQQSQGDRDSEQMLLDILGDRNQRDPAELLAEQENSRMLRIALENMLSPFEKKVFALYLQGKEYQEIAQETDKPAKSIDNALQRIKQKARDVAGRMQEG